MTSEVQVPDSRAVEHIDWQFLEHLRALEAAIDPRVLSTNVLDSLKINENQINHELERQPSLAFQFSAIAVRTAKILAIFEATLLKQYHAHVHEYAKHYMRAINEKDTIDGRKEYTVKLFGRDVTSEQRGELVTMALRGYMLLTLTVAKLEQYISADPVRWVEQLKKFGKDMYPETLIFYEDMVAQHENMREKKELASSLADTFRQRGIAVTSIASNLRSGGEADGLRLRGRVDAAKIIRIRQAFQNNPAATDEWLAQIVGSLLQG